MKVVPAILATMVMLMTLSSCEKKKIERENPLLGQWETPYGVPPFDKIESRDFMPALEQTMSLHNAQIDAIVNNNDAPSFENVIQAYDRSGQELERVALVLGMLCEAECDDELRAVQGEAMPMLAAHDDRILLNEALFAKIKAVYETRKAAGLDAEQLRLTEKTYEDFRRSGAELAPKEKQRLAEINKGLAELDVRFGENLLAENNGFTLELENDELVGIPSAVRTRANELAREHGKRDKYIFTLQAPSLFPFLSYAKDRDLRRKMFEAYTRRCDNGGENDNNRIINDYLRLRTEKAHLLGYKSYADYVLAGEMAGSVKEVYALLDEIWEPALEKAREELDEMSDMFRQDHPDGTFEPWDWWYYAEKLRKKKYSFDEESLRPYFSLPNVQSGVFFLANRLYGLTFRPVSVPKYHRDVMAYEVLDVDETHLGVLYFDYFPREGKSQGAWCGNYVEQGYKDGKRVAPVVSIVTNFTPAGINAPSQLSVDEVKTLFHEFGHALHFLFHDVKYRGLSEVEGDFVELPSQLMENWALNAEMLDHYALHSRTNDRMSKYMLDNLHRSALFNQGFMTVELLAAAYADLDLHSMEEYHEVDLAEFERETLNKRRGLMPQILPRYRYPYFSHIFDGSYTAGYYFYVWAEVLEKDAFEAFRESGDLFDRRVAARFRREVLQKGGTRSGMEMYRTFRGKNPDRHPMLKARGLWTEPEPVDSLAVNPVVEPAEEKNE